MAGDTDTAWNELWDKLQIVPTLEAQGYAPVSAEQIKTLTGREPRLMAKFDTREQRPAPLRKRGCTIVPVTNQGYWVVDGDGYEDLGVRPLPQWHRRMFGKQLFLESLPVRPHSEAEALEIASSYGLLNVFLGEEVVPTRRGRRRTQRFDYWFRGKRRLQVPVDGVQVEIDACYEGEKVYVVEAKLGGRGNFLSRQLYYPLRMLRSGGPGDRVNKPIVPIFMTWSNGLFSFHRFAYSDESDYHSLELVQSACYTLDPRPYPRLSELLDRSQLEPERTDVPFPQADSVEKVADVVDGIANGVVSHPEIAQRYAFDERHARYYADAARYLGLLQRDDGYALTEQGEALVHEPSVARVERLALRMLATPVFRLAAEATLQGEALSTDDLAERLAHARSDLSGTTLKRRAQTVSAWLRWAQQTFPESR
jgi:hypothetical protein